MTNSIIGDIKQFYEELTVKKVAILSVLFASTLVLNGCGKSSSESSQSSISAAQTVEAKVDPIVIENDRELGLALGMLGNGDALLKKKLGTSVGNPIVIKSLYVWSTDSSEWEKGGKLHLINDDSMGRAYRVICSISSQDGDKFMETKKRRDVAITGVLKDYSSSEGLTIDPCTATWESEDKK